MSPWPSQCRTEKRQTQRTRITPEIRVISGAHGVQMTVEVHRHSIVDNMLHLLDLTDSPHVFANPDLGNIYWCYTGPEETSEDSILALQEPASGPHL